MCGIFGFVKKEDACLSDKEVKSALIKLFKLSESRGKEAAGLAMVNGDQIIVNKQGVSASLFLRSESFRKIFDNHNDFQAGIGHARLVTNGSMTMSQNNQPVVCSGIVAVHNGIIVNDSKLWQSNSDLSRQAEVDTEILLVLLRKFLSQDLGLVEAVKKVDEQIKGTASVAVVFDDLNQLLLYTNCGSLYYVLSLNGSFLFFASEAYILKKLIDSSFLNKNFNEQGVKHLKANRALVVDIVSLKINEFDLKNLDDSSHCLSLIRQKRKVVDQSQVESEMVKQNGLGLNVISRIPKDLKNYFGEIEQRVNELKRCTKCVLPETMPFIKFDENGVCNYCKNYKKIDFKGEEKLKQDLGQKVLSGKQKCLLPLSGGRDSSYALYYAKKVLGLEAVAFSYDWGMVTDLARRNQARMCGELGVEHILISADIKRKRENIRKNVSAWLKKPDLGTVTLFMAGDKQYFYYLNKLKKQLAVTKILYGENPLEKTDFKYGFCGVAPVWGVDHVYDQGLKNKLKLFTYFAKKYATNPAYLNSSLFDTFWAYTSSYFMSHEYVFLYNYIKWQEEEIEKVLIGDYDWELAADTKTSWRIGDGTAAFYNYIYYVMGGLTENDTFRSNQIREGQITRKRALDLVKENNKPRWDSLVWYSNTIGISLEKALIAIQTAPKKYKF